MKTYRVNEIFLSVQGEGARIGSLNVFVRFADCNLTCGFCDTEFESGRELSAMELALEVKRIGKGCPNVILTGGEPLLQYDQELHAALITETPVTLIACETNGSVAPKATLEWICCSPKVAEHVVQANFPAGVDELRYVRHPGQGIPKPLVNARKLFISPEFNGNHLKRENLEWCIQLIKENPKWRLSVQLHKFLAVR